MPDNLAIKSDAAATIGTVATDKVTHSGDTNVDVQLMRPVHVIGSEGTKTVVDLTETTYGLQVNVGKIVTPADAQVTRPADTTPYTVGDLIANSTTAGSVTRLSWTGATRTASGGSGRIVGFLGRKSGTVATRVRYHFLKTDHAVTNGDNGALVLTSLDIDNYFGFLDVAWGATELIGSGGECVSKSYDEPVPYVLSSGDTIYCVMQALDAFTPASAGTIGGRPIFEVRS